MSPFQLRLAGFAAVVLLALAPTLVSAFSITLMNFIGIYAIAVLGLVLLTGIGGMLSFGQAAFVGLGAYATAWLTAKQGYSPWLGLVLALTVAAMVAAILGAVTLRLMTLSVAGSGPTWLAPTTGARNTARRAAPQKHVAGQRGRQRSACPVLELYSAGDGPTKRTLFSSCRRFTTLATSSFGSEVTAKRTLYMPPGIGPSTMVIL